MSSQERTIIGACDYSLAFLSNIKSTLMDHGHPKREINWAIGSPIIVLSAHLLRLCHDRFMESVRSDDGNAISDIRHIQQKFNEFIDAMVNND